MAMVKLDSVPISTYSVIFTSLAFVNSPKRKTDFAARRNPIPSMQPTNINVSIRILSKYPIQAPALGRLFLSFPSGVHFAMNVPKRMTLLRLDLHYEGEQAIESGKELITIYHIPFIFMVLG